MNPHTDTKFTKCPRCETKTNLRKLSLVIHVEGFGLIILGKTCRLCLRCDTLIAHKAELDKVLRTVVTGSKPEYFVLGTADRATYRRGLAGGASLEDVMAHMAAFKSYWNVEITPAGWYPKNERGTGRCPPNQALEPTALRVEEKRRGSVPIVRQTLRVGGKS